MRWRGELNLETCREQFAKTEDNDLPRPQRSFIQISLWDDNQEQGSFTLPNKPLKCLAYVDPLRIPMYIACHPNLKVVAETDEEAKELHRLVVASGDSVDQRNGTQPLFGMLTAVSWDGEVQSFDAGPRTTEILIYGAWALGDSNDPDSFAIYALPLSSDLLYKNAAMAKKGDGEKENAELNEGNDLIRTTVQTDQNPQRARLNALFNEATERKSKARKRQRKDEEPAIQVPTINYDQRNRSLISRMVLVGMRLHGLETRGVENEHQGIGAAEAGNDELKIMYNLTLRSTAFALRKNIETKALKAEDVRFFVDRLLAIYIRTS